MQYEKWCGLHMHALISHTREFFPMVTKLYKPTLYFHSHTRTHICVCLNNMLGMVVRSNAGEECWLPRYVKRFNYPPAILSPILPCNIAASFKPLLQLWEMCILKIHSTIHGIVCILAMANIVIYTKYMLY